MGEWDEWDCLAGIVERLYGVGSIIAQPSFFDAGADPLDSPGHTYRFHPTTNNAPYHHYDTLMKFTPPNNKTTVQLQKQPTTNRQKRWNVYVRMSCTATAPSMSYIFTLDPTASLLIPPLLCFSSSSSYTPHSHIK
jgi:hypothetical protein